MPEELLLDRLALPWLLDDRQPPWYSHAWSNACHV